MGHIRRTKQTCTYTCRCTHCCLYLQFNFAIKSLPNHFRCVAHLKPLASWHLNVWSNPSLVRFSMERHQPAQDSRYLRCPQTPNHHWQGEGLLKAMLSSCWGQVGLAGAPQITLNTKDEAIIETFLLCSRVNLPPIQYSSKRDPRLFARMQSTFWHSWPLSLAWLKGLVTDIPWG